MDFSPLELDILVHYKKSDEASGPWDSVRIRRMCRQLQITERELCRLIRIAPHALTRYCQSNKFPAIVRLVLELFERSTHAELLGSVPKKPLIPLVHG